MVRQFIPLSWTVVLEDSMKLNYDIETDSLFIRLSEGSYSESEEVAYDIIFDFDFGGALTGIEILDVEHNATPSKLQIALQSLPKGLTLEEKQLVKLAFEQVQAGKHKQLDPIT